MKKQLTRFRPQIRSRHPSHRPLRVRGALGLLPFRSVVRFGSTTELDDTVAKGGRRIELNTVQSVRNASNKRLMKRLFTENNIPTPRWFELGISNFTDQRTGEVIPLENMPFPIVAKQVFGSRGRGNFKLDTVEELRDFVNNRRTDDYIFECFINFAREYRVHVSEDGCFYTNRKMLKSDTPEDQRWFRNDSNSAWYLETNPAFNKPENWNEIVEDCVNAMRAVGLDMGAVDLKVSRSGDYTVIEINSAPSFGEGTLEQYKKEIPRILTRKARKQL